MLTAFALRRVPSLPERKGCPRKGVAGKVTATPRSSSLAISHDREQETFEREHYTKCLLSILTKTVKTQ
jgi:hypothetical protein